MTERVRSLCPSEEKWNGMERDPRMGSLGLGVIRGKQYSLVCLVRVWKVVGLMIWDFWVNSGFNIWIIWMNFQYNGVSFSGLIPSDYLRKFWSDFRMKLSDEIYRVKFIEWNFPVNFRVNFLAKFSGEISGDWYAGHFFSTQKFYEPNQTINQKFI